ncbi:GntR family transcriptional regulator [Brachybacterium alimentarium]|uniref:GntR family transcriptional regulator n=1 Tax=Brachybacterium alimentarium TaxID=47845 RepID=UPI003FD62600
MRIAKSPLGSQVAHELRLRIFDGTLESGSLLIEGALSEEFGLSRGPVRDALAELRDDGLAMQSGRSLRVTEVDGELIREIYELRAAMEVYSVERALRHGADLSAAHRAIDAMRAAGRRSDRQAMTTADLAFHGTFFEAGGPIVQAHFWRVFQRVLKAVLEVNPDPNPEFEPEVAQHVEILNAIENDGNWRQLLQSHIERAVDRASGSSRRDAAHDVSAS